MLSRSRSEPKPPRFPLSFSLGVVPAPVRVREKKTGPLLLQPPNLAVQLPGSGACFNYTLSCRSRIIPVWSRQRIHDPFCPGRIEPETWPRFSPAGSPDGPADSYPARALVGVRRRPRVVRGLRNLRWWSAGLRRAGTGGAAGRAAPMAGIHTCRRFIEKYC
jgi:hypothetical protein